MSWLQAAQSAVVRYQANDAFDIWYRWEESAALDAPDETAPYYDTANWTSDSPGLSFDKNEQGAWVAKAFTDTRDFGMWLCFTPTGGHWVPLRFIGWHYTAEAYLSGEQWNGPVNSSNPVNSNMETENYPFWDHRMPKSPNYQPEE